MAITCSECGNRCGCTETRTMDGYTRRSYTCPGCGTRVTTKEYVVAVVGRDGNPRKHKDNPHESVPYLPAASPH